MGLVCFIQRPWKRSGGIYDCGGENHQKFHPFYVFPLFVLIVRYVLWSSLLYVLQSTLVGKQRPVDWGASVGQILNNGFVAFR